MWSSRDKNKRQKAETDMVLLFYMQIKLTMVNNCCMKKLAWILVFVGVVIVTIGALLINNANCSGFQSIFGLIN